jgi:hypothetical protein
MMDPKERCGRVGWFHLVQDTLQWQAPSKVGEFLDWLCEHQCTLNMGHVKQKTLEVVGFNRANNLRPSTYSARDDPVLEKHNKRMS